MQIRAASKRARFVPALSQDARLNAREIDMADRLIDVDTPDYWRTLSRPVRRDIRKRMRATRKRMRVYTRRDVQGWSMIFGSLGFLAGWFWLASMIDAGIL